MVEPGVGCAEYNYFNDFSWVLVVGGKSVVEPGVGCVSNRWWAVLPCCGSVHRAGAASSACFPLVPRPLPTPACFPPCSQLTPPTPHTSLLPPCYQLTPPTPHTCPLPAPPLPGGEKVWKEVLSGFWAPFTQQLSGLGGAPPLASGELSRILVKAVSGLPDACRSRCLHDATPRTLILCVPSMPGTPVSNASSALACWLAGLLPSTWQCTAALSSCTVLPH